MDSDIGVSIGARVKETPSGRRLLVDDEGNVKPLNRSLRKLQIVGVCLTLLSVFPS